MSDVCSIMTLRDKETEMPLLRAHQDERERSNVDLNACARVHHDRECITKLLEKSIENICDTIWYKAPRSHNDLEL